MLCGSKRSSATFDHAALICYAELFLVEARRPSVAGRKFRVASELVRQGRKIFSAEIFQEALPEKLGSTANTGSLSSVTRMFARSDGVLSRREALADFRARSIVLLVFLSV